MVLRPRAVAFLITFVLVLTGAGGGVLAEERAGQSPETGAAATYRFDLPAQPLADSLRTIARQTGTNVLFDSRDLKDTMAPALSARLTTQEAINYVIASTKLQAQRTTANTIIIRPATPTASVAELASLRLSQNEPGSAYPAAGENSSENQSNQNTENSDESSQSSEKGIPEILIRGSKILNMDIERTEDDIQPYMIFRREVIEDSGATTLEDFLRNQLTADVNPRPSSQEPNSGNRSSINLRGLGTDETLILVDGRRVAQLLGDSTPGQPDINGIPLSAIERIEVLPTTASGIYGGSATGGVINVVLRRDYSGVDVKLTYGSTFDGGGANRRADLSGGLNLRDGKTNITISGTYSNADPLLENDRDFIQRARLHVLTTNPALLLNNATPLLGATPNIRSATSANLVLDSVYGGTNLGSNRTYIPVGYSGVSGDAGAGLVANAGQYNLALPDTAQDQGAERALLNSPEVKSLMMTIRHEFTPWFRAFLDLQASNTSSKYVLNGATINAFIPANAPSNPFQQDIVVAVPAIGLDDDATANYKNRKATVGLIATLPGRWQGAIDFTWNRARSDRAAPAGVGPETVSAITSGSLDVLRDLNQELVTLSTNQEFTAILPADSIMKNTGLRIAGPLPWSLPAGNMMLSGLIEKRDESVDDRIQLAAGGFRRLIPSRDQTVNSGYLELKIPLVSSQNQMTGVKSLELQAAARRDDYRVTGASIINLANPAPVVRFTNKDSSVDPVIGFRYQPVSELTVRASYGTGFKPPSMSQVATNATPIVLSLSSLTDPLRGGEPLGLISVEGGGNPDLRPESSESWSGGLILKPRALPGLRLSADWSEISKTDNITTFLISQESLATYLDFLPERVTRGAPDGAFEVGPITGWDLTLVNIARLDIKALDLAIDYERPTDHLGTLRLLIDASRLTTSKAQATPAANRTETAGVLGFGDLSGGVQWKATSTLNWSYRNSSVGWRTRFVDSYFVNVAHTIDTNQGAATIPSQTYHDLFGSYRFNPSDGSATALSVLSDVEIRLGVNNVFNRKPPIDVVTSFPTGYSPLGDPRLATYYLTLRKSFGH